MATVAHVKSFMDISNQWSLSVVVTDSSNRLVADPALQVFQIPSGYRFQGEIGKKCVRLVAGQSHETYGYPP